MTDVADRAQGRWRHILATLTPQLDRKAMSGKHGPCPFCGGKDRFRWTNFQGNGGFICGQCGPGDGFELVKRMTGKSYREVAKMVEEIVGKDTTAPKDPPPRDGVSRERLAQIWRGTVKVTEGDAVQRYLKSRGIETGRWAALVPPNLRLHPNLRHPDGKSYPAMVARVVGPGGDGTGLHRTYLTPDGQKADTQPVRLGLGTFPTGCAVRFNDPKKPEDTTLPRRLAIAEGIETALAVRQWFGVTTWAVLAAGLMAKWVPPTGVEELYLMGDNDSNYTGHMAVFTLANRLATNDRWKGIRLFPQFPATVGRDWLDEMVNSTPRAPKFTSDPLDEAGDELVYDPSDAY